MVKNCSYEWILYPETKDKCMPIDGYQLCVAYASSSNSCYIIKCNQQGLPKKKKLNVNQFSQTESTS